MSFAVTAGLLTSESAAHLRERMISAKHPGCERGSDDDDANRPEARAGFDDERRP